ncbi:tail fiber assembly protein [Escherichia coli]|nr:tail fiber assembly protein [Escherichia coli]
MTHQQQSIFQPEPTLLRAQAEAKKSELLSAAAIAIAALQDAADEGMATAEETAALSEWKIYRVKVMRVDTSKPE